MNDGDASRSQTSKRTLVKRIGPLLALAGGWTMSG